MNTSYQKNSASDEWHTPRYILDALGHFDLDPCAAQKPLFPTAEIQYNINDDGLAKEWHGRVWLNPPYSQPKLSQFIDKMIEHNHGIALTFNRCDNSLFQDKILPNASALLFMRQRIRFFRPDGTQGGSPGCGSVLIAFGAEDAQVLKNCRLRGFYIDLKNSKLIKDENN